MRIAEQKATLHAILGEPMYIQFESGLRAYFEYSSARWSAVKNQSGDGHNLTEFLATLPIKSLRHDTWDVYVISGITIPFAKGATQQKDSVCTKDLVFRFEN